MCGNQLKQRHVNLSKKNETNSINIHLYNRTQMNIYKIAHDSLRAIHRIMGGLAMEGPLVTDNKYLLLLSGFINISTMISWKYYGGCLIMTLEHKLKSQFDPTFDYIQAENRHMQPTSFFRYGVLILSVVYGFYKVYKNRHMKKQNLCSKEIIMISQLFQKIRRILQRK